MKSAIVSSASSLLLIIVVGLQTALILRPHYAEAATASVSSKSNNNAAAAAAADDDTLENKLATLLSNKDITAQLLSEKSAEYAKVQAAFHDKLAKFKSRQSELQAEKGNGSANDAAVIVEALHENMDAVSLKLMQLIKRTEDVTRRVGEFNKAALLHAVNENESGGGGGGLEERLTNVMRHEIERRHRLDEMSKQAGEEISADDDNTTEAAAERGTEYMTLEQLDELFTRNNIIQPTDNELKQKLKSLAINLMDQRTTDDEEFWKKYFATATYDSSQKKSKSNSDECIGIASAVELVGNTLASHYYDGGTNMVDVASYENGGSVCYELTSAPYQPPPRNGNNNHQQQQQVPSQVDKETEGMYYDQQLHDDDDAAIDKVDIWDWYTNFKLDGMRKYLPDDWERVFDKLSSSTSNTNWGEYTPRGVIDALIPDYVYHAFGIANTVSYGSVYGRTASPEVAIQAGYSKVGGGGSGGWSPKVLGNCYPLSMRPENDPILSIMSRHTHMEGGAEVIDEDADTSLLVGPKYTVRLPYSIHIDAVSIEHRSFPLPQSALADGMRGGESAPRWVKVVGFPPCKTDDDGGNHLMEGEDGDCGKLGFDMNQPIDLGSFEYKPVTVSGREDDYGGGEDSDHESSRRSVQTFVVKGGKLNRLDSDDVEEDNASESHRDEPDLEVEYEIPAGSCVPPKEPDEIPSCGGDDTSSSSFSDKSERQLVSAVSFIIEENWGNSDYTCLYRVQVHGDPIEE